MTRSRSANFWSRWAAIRWKTDNPSFAAHRAGGRAGVSVTHRPTPVQRRRRAKRGKTRSHPRSGRRPECRPHSARVRQALSPEISCRRSVPRPAPSTTRCRRLHQFASADVHNTKSSSSPATQPLMEMIQKSRIQPAILLQNASVRCDSYALHAAFLFRSHRLKGLQTLAYLPAYPTASIEFFWAHS